MQSPKNNNNNNNEGKEEVKEKLITWGTLTMGQAFIYVAREIEATQAEHAAQRGNSITIKITRCHKTSRGKPTSRGERGRAKGANTVKK